MSIVECQFNVLINTETNLEISVVSICSSSYLSFEIIPNSLARMSIALTSPQEPLEKNI